MSYEITGKIIVKYETQQITDTFKKREFVLEKTDDINGRTIVNYVKFQSVQDRCSILDRFEEGEEVNVFFNIRGNKWERDGKVNYITNLDAWRLEKLQSAGSNQIDPDPNYNNSQENFNPSPESIDDLPF